MLLSFDFLLVSLRSFFSLLLFTSAFSLLVFTSGFSSLLFASGFPLLLFTSGFSLLFLLLTGECSFLFDEGASLFGEETFLLGGGVPFFVDGLPFWLGEDSSFLLLGSILAAILAGCGGGAAGFTGPRTGSDTSLGTGEELADRDLVRRVSRGSLLGCSCLIVAGLAAIAAGAAEDTVIGTVDMAPAGMVGLLADEPTNAGGRRLTNGDSTAFSFN